MRVVSRWRLGLALLAFACSVTGPAQAAGEPGVSNDRIVFGQSAAFKGPAAALGNGMREGILAAFREANKAGGIGGRQLELISYNDGYEPETAMTNTRRLIEEDEVFAIIGDVGTPTSRAVLPITTDAGVPFLGPLTGAGFLREPSLPNVINVRASYEEETEAWITHLVDKLGLSRIAILYQDDSFGMAGLEGVRRALGKRGLGLVAEGTYKRNTTAIKRALLAIRKGRPQAIVMVGAYQPTAAFVKLAKSLDLDAVYVSISFVGSRALSRELGAHGEGVIVSQVVPLPTDTSIPLVARYQRALRAADPEAKPGFVSLEGYLVGRLVIDALRRMDGPLTRDRLLATIRKTGTFDLDGIVLNYGPGDNQGMDRVFLTILQGDGAYTALDQQGQP